MNEYCIQKQRKRGLHLIINASTEEAANDYEINK